MPIQLAGNAKHGGLFEAAFGLTLGEIVEDIGGGTPEFFAEHIRRESAKWADVIKRAGARIE